MLNQELLNLRHNSLKIFDLQRQVLKGTIHQKVKTLLNDTTNTHSVEEIRYMQYLIQYTSMLCDRILNSDDFVKLFYEVLQNPIQKYERVTIKLETTICSICKINNATEIHHIIPLVYGGNNESYNLISLCNTCHKEDSFEFYLDSLKTIKTELIKNFS